MMTEPIPAVTAPTSSLAGWGDTAHLLKCAHCDWTYVNTSGVEAQPCPHCYAETLTPLEPDAEHPPLAHPPESFLPFSLTPEQVHQSLRRFAKTIPLAPADLKAERLAQRLQKLFLPRWLVDADVEATWQGEVGFKYDVVSHEEHFDERSRSWKTKRITVTKVRWEPRAGTLQRRYENITAPALEEDETIRRRLGRFRISKAKPFRPAILQDALTALPNRSPEDAWPDAIPGFQQAGVRDCRIAAGGDKIRDYRWRPTYRNQHWTILLQPVYSTYYLDDDNIPRPVLIHGQSGRCNGQRRASMKRAKRITLALALLALVLLLLGIFASLANYFSSSERLLDLSVFGLMGGALTGLLATFPMAFVWTFNREQQAEEVW